MQYELKVQGPFVKVKSSNEDLLSFVINKFSARPNDVINVISLGETVIIGSQQNYTDSIHLELVRLLESNFPIS